MECHRVQTAPENQLVGGKHRHLNNNDKYPLAIMQALRLARQCDHQRLRKEWTVDHCPGHLGCQAALHMRRSQVRGTLGVRDRWGFNGDRVFSCVLIWASSACAGVMLRNSNLSSISNQKPLCIVRKHSLFSVVDRAHPIWFNQRLNQRNYVGYLNRALRNFFPPQPQQSPSTYSEHEGLAEGNEGPLMFTAHSMLVSIFHYPYITAI